MPLQTLPRWSAALGSKRAISTNILDFCVRVLEGSDDFETPDCDWCAVRVHRKACFALMPRSRSGYGLLSQPVSTDLRLGEALEPPLLRPARGPPDEFFADQTICLDEEVNQDRYEFEPDQRLSW